jgi:hypothetical protein
MNLLRFLGELLLWVGAALMACGFLALIVLS